jgi:hypothetical protein
MDEELLFQIRKSLQSQKSIRELDGPTSVAVLNLIESNLIEDPGKIWWWDSLRSAPQVMDYGDADVFPKILGLAGENQLVRLVVTDDEPRPWQIFEGPLSEILSVVAEQRYFEYFITEATSQSPSWLIFDTHHNQLVVAGTISGTVKPNIGP